MLSEDVEIWEIMHSNTQWWLKGKDGGKMGYKIREECGFLKGEGGISLYLT